MASVASQLIEEVTAHGQNSMMRERYAQTVLTFQITYVHDEVRININVGNFYQSHDL